MKDAHHSLHRSYQVQASHVKKEIIFQYKFIGISIYTRRHTHT